MIELQQLNAQRYGAVLDDMAVCDFEHLPFVEEFDTVVFYDCLHHSDDEVLALRGAYAALKPGGVCITLEPGRGHHATADSIHASETLGTTEPTCHPASSWPEPERPASAVDPARHDLRPLRRRAEVAGDGVRRLTSQVTPGPPPTVL